MLVIPARKMMLQNTFLPILAMAISCSNANDGVPRSEIIQFTSGDILLEGVLDLPKKEGKVPLVVFVHGSGRRTHSDYEEFVPPLLKAGFATFRYDKRGVDASGGTYVGVETSNSPTTIPTLAMDAASAIMQLKHHSKIDSTHCILIGASQAGWIIPVAAGHSNLFLTVCFSGPAVTVGEEIYFSHLAENGDYTVEEASRMVQSFHGNHGFDPISYIQNLRQPSLWIFGEQDQSIPVDRSIQLLEAARDSLQLPIQIHVIPGVNHSLMSKDGKFADYVGYILAWIKTHLFDPASKE